MADAAKSDEIEDVLSSIRRLVSEHHPSARTPDVLDGAETVAAQDEPDDPGAPEEPSAERQDKLILTPALRVTDPEDPWVAITPRAEDDTPGGADEPGRADGADWAEALWADADEETDPERATADPTDHVDPQLQADQWESAGPADVDEDDAQVLDEAYDGAGGVLDLDDPLEEMLSQGVEEAEDDAEADIPLSFIRSTKSVRDYEPEEGDNEFEVAELPSAMRELAQARASQGGEATEDEGEASRVRVEIVKAAPMGAGQQGADNSQNEQEGADPLEADEPDRCDEDFLAASPDEREDVALSDAGIEDLGESPFTFPDDGDSFVDEEALRELIAEVVREELQGDMGVRITRNIRKLVRREIRLALAAQDLD